jgi:hypothetical protein
MVVCSDADRNNRELEIDGKTLETRVEEKVNDIRQRIDRLRLKDMPV